MAAFCTAKVAALMTDAEPVQQGNSRNNLTAATTQAGSPAPPTFQLPYAQALNAALVAQLGPAKKASLRKRLNAAIVAAKVSAVGQTAGLQQVTILLMSDPAEPVLMWALKAAQPQVPQVLAVKVGNAAPALVAAIAPAVFKHPSGPIFEEAYKALNVNDAAVKDELLKLWGNRLAQYQGKEPPDDADVDRFPVSTLTTTEMWKTVLTTPMAQADVMQMISDQLAVASQWADATPAGEKKDQLVLLVQRCAGGVYVVGGHQNMTPLRDSATNGSQINPKNVPANFKTAGVVNPIIPAIAAAFPGVKPPPVVAGPGAGVAAQPQKAPGDAGQ
jgi:hypothetical protein